MAGGQGGRAGSRIGSCALRWPVIWLSLLVLEFAAGGALVWVAGAHGPALLAVAINMAVCLRFAVTLRAGQVPLITRFARADEAGLPHECERYTRRLTLLWAGLLGVFALLHAGVFLDSWTTRAASGVESFVLLLLFLGEHPLRARLFPQIGPVTPLRTLRAMRLALGARHAA